MNTVCSITKQFLAGVSLGNFEWNISEADWQLKDEVWQTEILNSTVLNPLLTSYPISKRYKKQFMKALIKKLEEGRAEGDQQLSDKLYEICAEFMLESNDSDGDFFYRIYTVGDYLIVPIRESGSFVLNGSTGLVTWQAAKALTEWCLLNKDLFENRNVLEVGCGLGLTGIVLCKTCNSSTYVFTDCHPQVISVLKHNIAVNFNVSAGVNEHDESKLECGKTSAYVVQFDWEDEAKLKSIKESFEPHILLAADVVYDVKVIPSLLHVLTHLLTKARAFIACTVRDESTIDAFIQEAERRGLKWTTHECSMTQFYYDRLWKVKIFELTRAGDEI